MTTKNTQLATRPLDALKGALAKPAMQNWLQKQIARSLNRNADQLINVVLHAAAQSPKLAECTPTSVLAALVTSAQIGLVPNTALGHAWLVPFKNKRFDPVARRKVDVMEATLIVGYQGFVKLVHEASGAALKAAVVYENEPFEFNRAAFPPVRYHGCATGKKGKLLYTYCLANLGGTITGEVYDEEFVHARRQRSRSYGYRDEHGNFVVKQDSPWVTDAPAMWLKTAIRAFTVQVPKGGDNSRLERAIEVDNLDDAHLAQGSVVDMVSQDLPQEVGQELAEMDAQVIEHAARQELGPAQEEELQRWTAFIRETSTPAQHAEVKAKIARAGLPPEILDRLAAVSQDHDKRMGGR
jgi:recombination protein RecT